MSLDQCVPAVTSGGLPSVDFPRIASGDVTRLLRCGNEKTLRHCPGLDAIQPRGFCFLTGTFTSGSDLRASRQLTVGERRQRFAKSVRRTGLRKPLTIKPERHDSP